VVVVVIDGAAAAEVVVVGADAGAKTASETDAAKRGSKDDDEEGAAWEWRDRIVTRFLARTRAASAALPDKLGTVLLLLRTTVCLLLFTGSQMVSMR